VTKKLFDNGLTAFDPKKPDRRNAANASIKASLDLLSKENVGRLNRIVASVVFGNTIPKSLLAHIWKLSKEDVTEICIKLWSFGLVSFAALSYDAHSIEVHLVIMQYLYDNLQIDDVFQMLLNSFFDLRTQIHYFAHTAETLLEVGLDNDQLGCYFIDALDTSLIPLIMQKTSMVVQAIVTTFHGNAGLFKFIGLPELKKQTFLTVRQKYRILLSFLNDRKSEEAIAYITKENDECIQYCTKLLQLRNAMVSSPWFATGVRNAYEPLVGIMSCFPQIAQVYVALRRDIQTMVVSKTFTVRNLNYQVDIFADQAQKIVLPWLHRLAEVVQSLISTFPDAPVHLKTLGDLLAFQSGADVSGNFDIGDYLDKAISYISHKQCISPDTPCSII